MSKQGDGFTRKTVELSKGRIHYSEAGSGETLLFVHGWGVNGTLWKDVAPRLAEGHRCIVPDLPFGSHPEAFAPETDLSPTGAAKILAELIEKLDLDRVTIIANDSGGAVTQIYAAGHPERLARIVFTNCDALEKFPPGTFKLLVKALRLPGSMSALTAGMKRRFVQRSPLAYGALTERRLTDAELDSWVKPLNDPGVRRDSQKFGSGMDPKYTLEAAEKLRSLDIPVLLTWGVGDSYFTIELAERLAAVFPKAELVRFERGLTFLSLDEPEELADEVAKFTAANPLDAAATAA